MAEPISATGPNAQQIAYWNEQAGPRWVALQEFVDAQIRPLGNAVMELASIGPGQRVLDVGCGCGHTTLDLAQRVSPSGTVTGIDISTVMLERARRSAAELGVGNVSFLNADAQIHPLEPEAFDVVFSRFGVMFFAHPEDAFANLGRALRPNGRLAFVCWQSLQDNAWMLLPLMAVLPHIPPMPPPVPNAPGPFAFADADRVRGILTGAGYVDVRIEPLRETLTIGAGRGLDEVVGYMLQMGPAASAVREANAEASERIFRSVREALQPHFSEAGLRLPSAAWLVTARRP